MEKLKFKALGVQANVLESNRLSVCLMRTENVNIL